MTLWHGQEVQPLPGLTFDEAAHKYTIEGRGVRGITSYTGLLRDHRFVEQEDLDWGSCVHDHLYHHDMGTLDWSRLDPRMEPYINGWSEFCKDRGWDTGRMLAEHKLCSEKYYLAGRLDRLFETEKYDWLVDIKTGDPDKVTGLQLAAYGYMAIEHRLTTAARLKLMEVCVSNTGHCQPQMFDYKTEFKFFIMQYSLVNRYNLKEGK